MNKIKSFFGGLILLVITFIIVVFVALIYRANEKTSVKSYIFQTNDFANKRVGKLQDINDISPENLRNKLIKKYVSEYFKVIPGEVNVKNRSILRDLSTTNAYKQWQNGEAENIGKMSDKNMLRIVHVDDNGIATLGKNVNKGSNTVKPTYYAVRYYMTTWETPNEMDIMPTTTQGTLYIEASFEPGLRETINDKKYSLKKYLEDNKNPAGLFMFKVTNVGNKRIM